MDGIMLKTNDLTKKYKRFKLKPTSINIEKGEIVALIGANGAGKSTFIKCLCGLVEADGGSIEINNQPVNKIDDKLVLGFMNQEQDVYSDVRIKDLTHFVVDILHDRFDEEIYNHYFYDVFKLDEEYKIKELSTGMRVKYFLSMELAKRPDFLVLDEPTSGLDPIIREEVLDILKSIVEENDTTILFSSHITEDIEKIADRVIFIDDGQIMLQGNKRDIKHEYVQINQEQYAEICKSNLQGKCLAIQDYFIIKRDDLEKTDISGREALLSDILYYIRKQR